MRQIGFDKKFTLLTQEAHLARNTLLSGFDLLLKANFFQDRDGYFYSAFFHIAIGMERMLKLAVITNHMLVNNYQTPSIKQLKTNFGHDIKKLYKDALELIPVYSITAKPTTVTPLCDNTLIDFFSNYSIASRYFNLNEVCEANNNEAPLDKWLGIAKSIYEDYTSPSRREKSALNLLYRMDRLGSPNGFTLNVDQYGNLMTAFDCYYRQYYIKKSAHLVIWRLIEILRPIHFLLEEMSYKASEYEVQNNITSMVIPHYEDFFYFLLASKQAIKRRRKWLDTFHS